MRATLALAVATLAGCATLADGHAGLDHPPSARTGPFRILQPGEIGQGRPAPFAMDDGKSFYRDPSVIDLDDDPSTFHVAGYFAANTMTPREAPPDRIVRFEAIDGRSFDPSGTDVLTATLDWEGGTVGAPAVVVRGREVLLYYAGAGGIGLARSMDGLRFDKLASPVLSEGFVGWASGAPRSPGVAVLPDGSMRLFYEADSASGLAIGEARSTDGVAWEPVDDGPSIRAGTALDQAGAGSPFALVRTSDEGRAILDVYYTAIGADGGHAVGLASRFLDGAHADDPLTKSTSSMLTPSPKLLLREPCVVRFSSLSFLFATENASKTSADPAVIAAVAPALVDLPPALPR